MASLDLCIKGTFDIAVARNRLRRTADANHWPPIMRARISAAMTTLAEIVMYKGRSQPEQVMLKVMVINNGVQQGLEFQCLAPFKSDISQHYAVAHWQLERACDDLIIENQGAEEDLITMRVLAR